LFVQPIQPAANQPLGKRIAKSKTLIGKLRQGKVPAFFEGSPQHSVDEVGNSNPFLFPDVFNGFIDHITRALFHEKGLIERCPQEIAHVLLEGPLHVMGKEPVEITLPAEDAGGYLVDQRLYGFRDGGPRESPIDGFIQRPPVLYPPYDVGGE